MTTARQRRDSVPVKFTVSVVVLVVFVAVVAVVAVVYNVI